MKNWARLCRLSSFVVATLIRLWRSSSPVVVPQARLRCAGFTVVELVVVVLILGVLAAAVLPRLTARKAALRADAAHATAAMLRDAAQMAHVAWSIQTSDTGKVVVPLSDGSQANMWHGYPEGGNCCSATGIEALVDVAGLDVAKPDAAHTRFEVRGAATPGNCSATYTEAINAGDVYTVTVDTSGC